MASLQQPPILSFPPEQVALQACRVLSPTAPQQHPFSSFFVGSLVSQIPFQMYSLVGEIIAPSGFLSRGNLLQQYIFWDSYFKMFSLHTWLIMSIDIEFLVGSHFLWVFGNSCCLMNSNAAENSIILIYDPGSVWPIFYSGSFEFSFWWHNSETVWGEALGWLFFFTDKANLNIWEIF